MAGKGGSEAAEIVPRGVAGEGRKRGQSAQRMQSAELTGHDGRSRPGDCSACYCVL